MTRVLAVATVCMLLAATALAQFGGGFRGPFIVRPNIHYDGQFTFVRLKYTTAPGDFGTADGRHGATGIRWRSRTSCAS